MEQTGENSYEKGREAGVKVREAGVKGMGGGRFRPPCSPPPPQYTPSSGSFLKVLYLVPVMRVGEAAAWKRIAMQCFLKT